MNYPRINLLKKNEQRHQGVVSRKFTLAVSVVAPVLVLSILSGIKVIQYTGVQSELKDSREIWADLEPKLNLFKEENRGLVLNRKALDLVDGWKSSQASFVQLLNDVQDTVPPNIQFSRLSIKSPVTPVTYASAEQMELAFSLVIDGSAQGENADNLVINLRRDLLGTEQIGSTFNSIRLASLRKKPSQSGDILREFRLEGDKAEGGTP